MFTKIKQFFLGKPALEAQAPYKVEAAHTHVEVAPITAPIVAEPVAAKPKTDHSRSAVCKLICI